MDCGSGSVGAAFRYEKIARSLVLGLKVRCLRPYALPLAEGIVTAMRQKGLSPAAVSWVPARPSARRTRGFDQAELLARQVARSAGLRCGPTLRAYERRDQVGLGRTMRAANADSAFGSLGPPARARDTLLLVDDLVTSGATAAACSEELGRAGWPRVEVMAACRA